MSVVDAVVGVGHVAPVQNDVVSLHVLVQFFQLRLEVQVAHLVLLFGLDVFRVPHLAVVAAVVFEHVAQWLFPLALPAEENG